MQKKFKSQIAQDILQSWELIKDGELGIFFPHDGQLSSEMVRSNKLHRNDGGYLEDNHRIRTIKLMGIKSEGIWLSLSSLTWAEVTKELKFKPKE